MNNSLYHNLIATSYLYALAGFIEFLCAIGIRISPSLQVYEGVCRYLKQKHAQRHVLNLCPFADLFRTTFPEIRAKYSSK
jgi:hypothetical protein